MTQTEQISKEKEKDSTSNSKKELTELKLDFKKKTKPQKEEQKTKQAPKLKEPKPIKPQQPGKPTFMQSLHEMFEKKVAQETEMVIFKEPSVNAVEIESYEIQPSYSKVTIM